MKNTGNLAEFNWVLLESAPKWTDVDNSCRILIEKAMFDSQKHQKLFHAFDYLKNYMDDERIEQFKNSNSIAKHWVEFFKHMENLAVDCTPLDEIVSYALSIPGTHFIVMVFVFRINFI